jgi:hypothetical protein
MRKVALLFLLLPACGLFTPDPPQPPVGGLQLSPTGGADSLTQTAWSWTALLSQWWWMSLLLLVFLPQVREPIAAFWSSVFFALSVPFLWVRQWWEGKHGGKQ